MLRLIFSLGDGQSLEYKLALRSKKKNVKKKIKYVM